MGVNVNETQQHVDVVQVVRFLKVGRGKGMQANTHTLTPKHTYSHTYTRILTHTVKKILRRQLVAAPKFNSCCREHPAPTDT